MHPPNSDRAGSRQGPRTRRRGPACALAAAAAVASLVLAACDDGEAPRRTITRERRWLPVGRAVLPGVPSAQRFRFERGAPAATATAAPGEELAWDTPPGWRELPTSSLRSANFLVAGDERAECYLTILGGDGGGLLANVNRWRSQMSLPPIDAAELDDAPRAPLLGSEAVLVDFEGTFGGMGGDLSEDGWRLVGLLSVDGGSARFLKMTGPTELVGAERDAFLELAASMRMDVPAHPPAGHAGATHGSGIAWEAPASWQRGPDRPMREVTFRVGPEGEGECYVALLGGTGGGAFANVNRWCDQMGAPTLSPAEFEALERIPVLGTQGIVVEVAGTYTGMGDELVSDARLLGLVCELPDRAVFVKLIAPGDVAAAAREDFLSFCRSLEL